MFFISCQHNNSNNRIVECSFNELIPNKEIVHCSIKDTTVLNELSKSLSEVKEIDQVKYLHKFVFDLKYENGSSSHIETTGLVFKQGSKYYECNLIPIIDKIKSTCNAKP